MDESVLETLDVMSEEELEKYEKSVRDEVRKSEYSCADFIIDKKRKGNIIVFTTGWNEGTFPTYYGFDKNNKLARLVTDFMVIEK